MNFEIMRRPLFFYHVIEDFENFILVKCWGHRQKIIRCVDLNFDLPCN